MGISVYEILTTSEVLSLHQIKALDEVKALDEKSKLWTRVALYAKYLEALDLYECCVIYKYKAFHQDWGHMWISMMVYNPLYIACHLSKSSLMSVAASISKKESLF